MNPEPETLEAAREPFALQVLEKMAALLTAAFGLVAALAWNEAIKGTIETYLTAGSLLQARYVYAIAVTVLAVLISIWVATAVTRVKRKIPARRRAAAAAPTA